MEGIGFPKPKRKVDDSLLERVRQQPCASCGMASPSDPSHLISRGAGGPDTPWNVAPQCRGCHSKWHQLGPMEFVRRHPKFRVWLADHGWDIDSNGAISIDMRKR
jgi:hypothetical protein